MSHRPLDVAAVRQRFPALHSPAAGGPTPVFFDGPAGSQVPASVAAAVADYLLHHNANHGGAFATSVWTDAMTARARTALVDFFGVRDGDPEEIVFGPNMTTLTFQLARALARTWRPGDEVVVTDSDHDANVMPWLLAARDAGCELRRIPVRADTTLDHDAAARAIGPRTRLVAFGAASNLSGTIHDVAALHALSKSASGGRAVTFVDAVHYAAHRRLDLAAWGADFAICSAYKFFGPHAGILRGRRALLEELAADKVRPAADTGAEKWQTGTASFEAIAGTLAAVEYLADLGREHADPNAPPVDRRDTLDIAFAVIAEHEQDLCARLLRGLGAIPDLRIVGIADPGQVARRCATVSFTHPRRPPAEIATALAERQVHCWAGNSYALALSTALGLEPDGALRLGLLHYATAEEVDRTIAIVRELLT
ncbi:MAG: cysteine desulfurase-like protein [Planctomycetes bacterium]|nr:cysteine desulfurase-like protein [Planctomycetota bacterium]